MITTTEALGYRAMMNNTDWRHELAHGTAHNVGELVAASRVDSSQHRTPYRAIPGGRETPANAFVTLWRNGLPIGRA